MATGRNRPCPCGSGKKFKNCCLDRSEERMREAARLMRAAQETLEPRLHRFASGLMGGKALESAWREFALDYRGLELEGPEIQLFEPWFLYEWRSKRIGGRGKLKGLLTLAEAYLASHGQELDELEAAFVRAAVDGTAAFHEVLVAQPGRFLDLRDVLSGNESHVIERSASKCVEPGDLVFGRVARFDGFALLIGAGSVALPPTTKEPLLAIRRSLREENLVPTARVLAELAEDLRTLYLGASEKLLNPQFPKLANTDGEPFLMHEIHYRIASAELTFQALKFLAKGYTEDEIRSGATCDAAGRLQSVEIPWLRPGNKLHKSWENTILGRISIEGAAMKIEVNSVRRAERIQREVTKHLGMHASHIRTVLETPEAALERAEWERKTKKGRELARKQSEFEELPETRALMEDLARSHWENWIHQKIPALWGMTPTQAVKDLEGREMVEALLCEAERSQEKAPAGQPRYDFLSLRLRLGLEKPQTGPKLSS